MSQLPDSVYNFNPGNPFPLLSLDELFSQRSKHHAKDADKFLGFEIEKVETEVRKERHQEALASFETWAHLDPQIFLTPYLELRYILEKIPLTKGETLVDLGCAYARLPFVLSHLFNNSVHFIGYDCVPHRIEESKRVTELHGISTTLSTQNICAETFQLPEAQHFFIYDTGTTSDVEKLLEKLRVLTSASPYKSLVTRGARIKQIIEQKHPWLGEAAEKNQNFSIYLF
jgi:hypothetical protein